MAKPIGMPMAHHPKNSANITQAARLMVGPIRRPGEGRDPWFCRTTSRPVRTEGWAPAFAGATRWWRAGGSQLVLPVSSEEAAQPQHRRDDRARHEDAEAGIKDVEADMEDQGPRMPGIEDVVDGAGQRQEAKLSLAQGLLRAPKALRDAPAGTVVSEMSRGYKLNERLARPAAVVVARPKGAPQPPEGGSAPEDQN